jgi:protein-S-isoprenylcysteine O-methyltransferase Ste14
MPARSWRRDPGGRGEILPAFVLYMNRYQIKPEERALELRFGREFADYTRRVRRWL